MTKETETDRLNRFSRKRPRMPRGSTGPTTPDPFLDEHAARRHCGSASSRSSLSFTFVFGVTSS